MNPAEQELRRRLIAQLKSKENKEPANDPLSPLNAAKKAMGSRFGLDPENYEAVQNTPGMRHLMPLADLATMGKDALFGGAAALASGAGSALNMAGDAINSVSDGNPMQGDARRDMLAAVTEMPTFGNPLVTSSAVRGAMNASVPRMAQKSAQSARPSTLSKLKSRAMDPEAAARHRIQTSFKDDMLGPQDLTKRLQEWNASGNSPATLVDLVGESGFQRVQNTASNIGPARKIFKQYTDDVVGAQDARAREIFKKHLSGKTDYFEELDALSDARKKMADPLYEAAKAEVIVPTMNVKLFAGTDMGQTAIKKALKIANAEQSPLEGVVKNGKRYILGESVPIRTLDLIKKGADDIIEKYRNDVTGKLVLNSEGNAQNKLLRKYISELDEASPTYKQTRDAWSGHTSAIDAMDRGEKFMSSNKSPAQIKRLLSDPNMTSSEKEFFRAGAVQALLRKVHKRADGGNKFKAIGGNAEVRGKIEALFDGDEQRASRFIQQLSLENERASRAIELSPRFGSATNPREKAAQHFSAMDALDPRGAMVKGGNWMMDKITGGLHQRRNQAIDEALARMSTKPITSEQELLSLLPIPK